MSDVFGTLVGAVIGVCGLAGVLWVERRDRFNARVDETLAGVILALGLRALELDDYTSASDTPNTRQMVLAPIRRKSPGGPSDAELRTAVEIASLAARRRRWRRGGGPERRGVDAIKSATFALRSGIVAWQIERCGQLAADIRRWRTGELTTDEFVAAMEGHAREAQYSAAEYAADVVKAKAVRDTPR